MTKMGRLRWFGHVEHKDDTHWVTQCILMESEETRQSGHQIKTWWDCVKHDMKSFGLSSNDVQNKNEWRVKKADDLYSGS